jgi:SAM-dependent methyltransferase
LEFSRGVFESLRKRLLRVDLKPRDISVAPLRIATEHYYYKPMLAFSYSFSLRAFRTARLQLEGPVLDVGCGDGTFGAMLKRLVGSTGHITGIDLNSDALHKARRAPWQPYSALVLGDATELPFADGRFRVLSRTDQSLVSDPASQVPLGKSFGCWLQTDGSTVQSQRCSLGKIGYWLAS